MKQFALFISFLSLTNSMPMLGNTMIRIPTSVPIELKDPLNFTYAEDMEIGSGLYESLASSTSSDEQLGFGVAQSWSYTPKTNVLKFNIRSGLKFSDGTDIDAQVVAFNLNRLYDVDKKSNGTLDICLVSRKDLSGVSPIRPQGDSVVEMKVKNQKCMSHIIYRVKSIGAGIISPRNAGSNNRLTLDSYPAFSGSFTLKSIEPLVILEPNHLHRFWLGVPKSDRPTLQFLLMKDAKKRIEHIKKHNLELGKTFRNEELNAAKDAGYHTQYSLPVMTWYLVPVIDAHPTMSQRIAATITHINNNLKRDHLKSFEPEGLETPTATFFPTSFNCKGHNRQIPKNSKRHDAVHLVEHKSGQSSRFSPELADAIKKLGYHVTRGYQTKPGSLNMQIQRFHLTANLSRFFDLFINVIGGFPDPKKKLHELVTAYKLNTESKTTQIALCEAFHHAYHVPIAHRRYAFYAKEKALLDLYSRDEGLMLLFRLPGILKKEAGHAD